MKPQEKKLRKKFKRPITKVQQNFSSKLTRGPNALQVARRLLVAVGKSAVAQVFREGPHKSARLDDVVGKKLSAVFHGIEMEVICLPHPSGVSRWPHSPSGKMKLRQALALLGKELPKLLNSDSSDHADFDRDYGRRPGPPG